MIYLKYTFFTKKWNIYKRNRKCSSKCYWYC